MSIRYPECSSAIITFSASRKRIPSIVVVVVLCRLSLERQNESFQNHIRWNRTRESFSRSLCVCATKCVPKANHAQAHIRSSNILNPFASIIRPLCVSVYVRWCSTAISHMQSHTCVCLLASKYRSQTPTKRNRWLANTLRRDQIFIIVKCRASSYRTGEGDFSYYMYRQREESTCWQTNQHIYQTVLG